MTNMRPSVLCIFFITTLSACAIFKPEGPAPPIPSNLPAQFSMYSEKTDHPVRWWQDFNSDELNGLIKEAITKNFSIKEAWARLEQASYTAMKTGAALYPKVSYEASRTYFERNNNSQAQVNSRDWSLGLSASYEVDLWGRVRAEKKSSYLLAQASEEDLKTAVMTVTGQIAELWIRLISNKKQQELFNRQLELQKQLLYLIKSRFPLAKSTALDIYQQQQSIEVIEASLIPLASDEGLIKRQLAFLLGKASMDDKKLIRDFPDIPRIPALGLPADLLAARPDIRSAGLRLKSAEWEIAAARADRLPSLQLTAAHTYSSNEISSIFDNWLRNLAVNLAGPVFDGRQRRMEVERIRALADERLASYAKTVFAAIKEVEDSLADEQQYSRTMDSLKRQLLLSERTMREAKRRYLNGSSDFLNVLREQLNILMVRQNIITAEERMLIARINLYRALGGSWVNEYVNNRQSSE